MKRSSFFIFIFLLKRATLMTYKKVNFLSPSSSPIYLPYSVVRLTGMIKMPLIQCVFSYIDLMTVSHLKTHSTVNLLATKYFASSFIAWTWWLMENKINCLHFKWNQIILIFLYQKKRCSLVMYLFLKLLSLFLSLSISSSLPLLLQEEKRIFFFFFFHAYKLPYLLAQMQGLPMKFDYKLRVNHVLHEESSLSRRRRRREKYECIFSLLFFFKNCNNHEIVQECC